MHQLYCGKNKWGFRAWEKLISMSNFEDDAKRSQELANGKSCAIDEETRRAEEQIRNPVRVRAAYKLAQDAFKEAEKMPDGPERDKKWREAAAAYRTALEVDPAYKESPEAAMNGAYAYKKVGEYDKAIAMYDVFIARYGSEKVLDTLKNGDPKAKPPVAAKPKEYEERVGFLKGAHEALAGAYVLFFNYPKAAETFDNISKSQHFDQKERRNAARQALSLYTSLGDRGSMNRARDRLVQLGATPKEVAEADFIVATLDLKRWDEHSPDAGANAQARKKALKTMLDYYDKNKRRDAAARFVVHAAYHVAKMKRAGKSADYRAWLKSTMVAFQRHKGLSPRKGGKSSAVGTQEAAMGAEAEYTLLDEEINKKFDYETGHHRFKGTAVEVVKDYKKAANEAKVWYDKLQHVVDEYVSPEWSTVTVARQGSLYDSLRTGLYNTRPPALKMFNKKMERLLKKAEESGNPDLQEKADAIRVSVSQAWRKKRDQEINGADKIMVQRYAASVLMARRYVVSNGEVVRAIRRLAFITDVIGEAKMVQHTSGVKELDYEEGMFKRMRPGQMSTPKADGMPAPLPPKAK